MANPHSFGNNLPKEFETFLHEIKSLVQVKQGALNDRIQKGQQECLQKSENDYLKCQTRVSKSLEKQEALFQFKMVFWRETSVQCFKNAEEHGDKSDNCRNTSKKLLESIFESFKI